MHKHLSLLFAAPLLGQQLKRRGWLFYLHPRLQSPGREGAAWRKKKPSQKRFELQGSYLESKLQSHLTGGPTELSMNMNEAGQSQNLTIQERGH